MSGSGQAVLVGGAFIGVLSALPLISLANVCCAWIVGGGVVAAYLLQQAQPEPIPLSDGAVVGCLAGVAGAVIYTVVSWPIQALLTPMQPEVSDLFATSPDVPPEVMELIDLFSRSTVAALVFGLVVMLILGVIFSTAGGVIGAAIVRRRAPEREAS